MESDLLDSLLKIEEQFYQEGYRLGFADGAHAGYVEGSIFAVEKGFEKFLEMGRLYGKALVWTQRLTDINLPGPNLTGKKNIEPSANNASTKITGASIEPAICKEMPSLPRNARLTKNIQGLLSQVDPATLSFENTEDAVSEMDDRLKSASLKAKLIQRVLGEHEDFHQSTHRQGGKDIQLQGDGSGSIEDVSSLRIRH
jgi:hypothetical protein